MTDPGQSVLPPLYRPAKPNPAWELGAVARAAKVSRDDCPYTYPGSRWEWQAGWDWEDREIEAGR
jgi:ribosome modulation factor